MAIEIERKFLLSASGWRRHVESARSIRQGYLTRDRSRSVRIRIVDGKRAWLTIKSGMGRVRHEFEYVVPLLDAQQMLKSCTGTIIEKIRHVVPHEGHLWEIDVYGGDLSGLVVAEVETDEEDTEVRLPPWAGREITGDPAFSNAALAMTGAVPVLAEAAQ